MTGRIPMVGDPKPFNREAAARDLADAIPRMHADAQRILEEAEASGDKKQIREAKATLKSTQRMMDRLG